MISANSLMTKVNMKFVVVAAASFISGYLYAQIRMDGYYSGLAADEIDRVKGEFKEEREEFKAKYEVLSRMAEDEDLVGAAVALIQYQGETIEREAVGDSEKNVPQYTDYAAISTVPTTSKSEETVRTADKEEPKNEPTLVHIHAQDFIDNEPGYEQVTLQYFAGDDVLIDATGAGKVEDEERQQIIGRFEDLLTRPGFWDGLEDQTFYLRNHDLKYDFEILFAENKYSDELKERGESG